MSSSAYRYPIATASPEMGRIRSRFGMNSMSSMSTLDWLKQSNRWLILVLSVLLIMALLDIRILNSIYNILLQTSRLLMNLVWRLLVVTGFVAGNTLEVAGELIGETGDVAEYTLGSVGKTLQTGANRTASIGQQSMGALSGYSDASYSDVSRDMPVGGQVKWCMVGDSNAKKGCMQMNAQDKCLSGRQFTNSDECLRAIVLQ